MSLVHTSVMGINFRKNTNQTSAGFGKNHGDKFLILRMNESTPPMILSLMNVLQVLEINCKN